MRNKTAARRFFAAVLQMTLMERVEQLPRDIRQCINRYLSVPYLERHALGRVRERIHSSNRWCAICGETNGYRRDYMPGYASQHARSCPRVVLLCWSCNRTICHTCSNEQRCCVFPGTAASESRCRGT